MSLRTKVKKEDAFNQPENSVPISQRTVNIGRPETYDFT